MTNPIYNNLPIVYEINPKKRPREESKDAMDIDYKPNKKPRKEDILSLENLPKKPFKIFRTTSCPDLTKFWKK